MVLLSLWAVYRTLRQEHSPYSIADRRIILFWAVAGAISLLLAWGRHAPLYQILYALPYFSTVRKPMKFMHVLHFALMILAAYGFEGIWRQYMTKPAGVPLCQHPVRHLPCGIYCRRKASNGYEELGLGEGDGLGSGWFARSP